MPSIPVYGFDELEPSLLNKAKRRVIGLMDMAEEHLTREPQKDPTNGKQNTDVEQLTEVIYNTIKDIEQLSGNIDDSSDIPNLQMIKPNLADTLIPLRPVLKEGAKQLVGINNSLRKINATYDSIQPNMIYTSLKAFIGLVNSVKILKKTTIKFFDILDTLSFKIEEAITPAGTRVVRQTIIEDDTDIVSPVDTSVDVPPILSTQEPFPPLPPAPYDPNVIIPDYTPLPPPPPSAPRPPKPPTKAKILSFKVKVSSKAKTAGLDAFQTADVLSLADDFIANNGRVADATEIDTLIADYLASPPQLAPASAPSTAPPAPSTSIPLPQGANYQQQDLDDLENYLLNKPMNVTQDQFADLQQGFLDLLASSLPDLPTEGEVDDMIDETLGTTTGTTQQTSTGTPEEEEKQAIKDFETETGQTATQEFLTRFKTISSRDQDDLFKDLDNEASGLVNRISDKQKRTLLSRINQAQSRRNVRNNSALETYIEFLKEPRIQQAEIDNAIANANNQKEAREIKRAYETYKTTNSIKTFFKRQAKYNQQIYA